MKKMTTALTALTVTAALGGSYAATAGSASAAPGPGHRDRHHVVTDSGEPRRQQHHRSNPS